MSILRRLFAKRLETGTKLFCQKFRLFPRGEVTTFLDFAVVGEVGVGTLSPASRRLIEFIREHAYGDRNGDALRSEKWELVLPIEACR